MDFLFSVHAPPPAVLVRTLVYNAVMSTPINVHEAKTHFSKLLERVALGEEIIIARAGEPVAKLSPLAPRKARTPGGAEGLRVPDSFFEPLPDDILDTFE
ncbi:MAG: Prevent host death protein, Phd antitoxin [uncultured Chloroflexia bacterium]|uniref:Antitoxin n=1 Tax=uncultured Chloroflexia bacterium TaxID=1672391 RepID=A0A6J4LSS4_9CHLR|nr:MAG: Prevent host death protein, Phd antitoxin [uncultured Chloroflexia bacterium]